MESLNNQIDNSFEVVFIDSGSDKPCAHKVQNITSQYTFCKYIYVNTQNLIWNKSYALNIGALNSKGQIYLIADIDLIFESHFIERIKLLNFNSNFYNYTCYYLPKGYNFIFDNWSVISLKQYRNSGKAPGLLIVSKIHFLEINGYDEYYQQWGIEDDDMVKRLKALGVLQIYLDENKYISLHQWHPENHGKKPSLWYLQMLNTCESNLSTSKVQISFGTILNETDRFNFFSSNNTKKIYEIFLPLYSSVTCFNEIVKVFFNISSNEVICIKHEQPKYPKKNGIKGWLISKIKQFIFRVLNLSNLNSVKLAETYITTEALFDFMIYFIGINRIHIIDYHLDYIPNNRFCIYLLKR